MGNMRFKVGDRVRIKSLNWYNENKDNYGAIYAGNGFIFWKNMVRHCGEIMKITIVKVDPEDSNKGYYFMENSEERWTDEMIEGLVEEENNPKFKKGDCVKCSDGSIGIIVTCDWSDSLNCYQYYVDYIGTLDAGYQPEKDLQPHTITTMNCKDIFESAKWKHEFECPEGYIFKDENGNVINATKIVLEKKKKEYPKTYDDCHIISPPNYSWILAKLEKLLICRTAYWKIAGEEMGLGKPWENSKFEIVYGICRDEGIIVKRDDYWGDTHAFEFPIREMRDAFYENFKEEIEECKEFL